MSTVLPRYATVGQAEAEFNRAWDNSAYTQIKHEDYDINAILTGYYEIAKPLTFTRELLWKAEVSKAWNPKKYIPHVVKDSKSWGRMVLDNGDGIFKRTSEQKLWLKKDVYGNVLEEVYLNHREQKITFLGFRELVDNENQQLQSNNTQPLFHVQHSVGGEENSPKNIWRIVHLTETKDQGLIDLFKKMKNSTVLPMFVVVYIEKKLNLKVTE